jgi:hypothetical protein
MLLFGTSLAAIGSAAVRKKRILQQLLLREVPREKHNLAKRQSYGLRSQ